MSTQMNGTAFHVVPKAEIVDKIKNSEKELRMLGTRAFDLLWQNSELQSLYDRYCGGVYEITIVAESDPSLYSDALVSSLGHEGVGIPMATLTETRKNSTTKIRDFFRAQDSKIESLDPEEDTYRKKLDALYTEKFARNVCDQLVARDHSYDSLFAKEREDADENNDILARLHKSCMERAKAAFDKSSILEHYLKERDFFGLNKASKAYDDNINNQWEAALKEAYELNSGEERMEYIFKFAAKDFKFTFLDEKSKQTCTFKLPSKDIQQMCLDGVLEHLQQKEQRDYELIRKYASEAAYKERHEQLEKYKCDPDKKQRFVLKEIFHPIPVQMLRVDGVYYATINPLPEFAAQEFLYVGDSNLSAADDANRFSRYEEYVRYFNTYMQSVYSTEETTKGNRKEVIYNYAFDNAVIGQMPRDSFYGSDNYKRVMWALVFDREGRILIHRRGNNAKDNQGMWDKSVGGHIDIKDRDSITGASREIAEELYSVEEAEQGHSKSSGWSKANMEKIIYLGKWKEERYPNIGTSLHLEPDEFYSFSFDSRMTEHPIDSGRVLPNGTKIKAKCFVDFYFVITSRELDLNELKNSKYLVLSPGTIKECFRLKTINDAMKKRIVEDNPDIKVAEIPTRFDVTPDLEYMINSPQWDNEITKFSIRVKEAFEGETKHA